MSIVSALRGAVQVYRAERAESALLAAHRAAVEAHLRASERYTAEHAAWARRRVLLSTIAYETGVYRGISLDLPADLDPRPGETLYTHVAEGGLIELRGPNADVPTVIGGGEIWVTSQRVIYSGAMVREWEFAEVLAAGQAPVHSGPAMTLLPSADRPRTSGISYPGAHQDSFRRRLDLAYASAAGTRQVLVDAAETDLARHVADEPAAPGSPPAPPVVHYANEETLAR